MKKIIRNCCLRTAKLLLCLLVFLCSCSSSKKLDYKAIKTSQPILQIAISESDLPLFIQRIQELNFVPIDLQQRLPDVQNRETKEFWITFRFFTKKELLVGRSEIMSTGLVSKVIHQ